jgi:hypothetical protein
MRAGMVGMLLVLLGCGGRASAPASPASPAGAGNGGSVGDGGDGGDGATAGAAGDDGAGAGGLVACADLDGDPLNCGDPGHVCSDDGCWRGTCRDATGGTKLVTGEHPSALAVDADNIYWLNRVPVCLSDVSHTQLKSCPLSGCTGQPTILWDDLQAAQGLAVANGTVFWTIVGSSTGSILSCSVHGCGGAPRTVVEAEAFVDTFAASATTVAFGTHFGAFACPVAGCSASSSTTLFEQTGVKTSFAIQGDQLFGTAEVPDDSRDSGQAPTLFACPLAGCPGGPTFFPTPAIYGALASDGQNAAWINTGELIDFSASNMSDTEWDDGSVYVCPLTGCADKTAPLVSYPAWFAATAIAVDASNVYWTEGPPSTESGAAPSTLVRCAIAGCAGKPTELATLGAGSTTAIALDASSVYWIDEAFGAIMKRAK